MLAIAQAMTALPQRAAALGPLRGRGRRGAGAARLGVPGRAPAGARRAHRRQHQHRRHEHLGPHARPHHDRPRASRPRRRGSTAIAAAQGRTRRARPVPGQGLLLPLRPVHPGQASACPPPTSTPAPTSSASRRAGARSSRRSSRRSDYHQPSDELRPDWDFSGAVEDAQLLFYLGVKVAERDRTCPPGGRATSSRPRARRRWPTPAEGKPTAEHGGPRSKGKGYVERGGAAQQRRRARGVSGGVRATAIADDP